jgi:hypothetical protein
MSNKKNNTNIVSTKTNAVTKDAVTKAVNEVVNTVDVNKKAYRDCSSKVIEAVNLIDSIIRIAESVTNNIPSSTVDRFKGLNIKLSKSGRVQFVDGYKLIEKRVEKEIAKEVRAGKKKEKVLADYAKNLELVKKYEEQAKELTEKTEKAKNLIAENKS